MGREAGGLDRRPPENGVSDRSFEPLPYYRWYWRAFRGSRQVQRLSYVARGLYREILDECWVTGFVRDDVPALAQLCGCPVKVMEANWSKIKQLLVSLGDGMYTSERLENERSASDKVRAVRAVSGAKGGKARKQNEAIAKQTEANQSNLLSSSSSSSMSKSSSSALGGKNPPRAAAAVDEVFRAICAENGYNPPEKVQ